jgi:hypothetical protein
VSRKLVKRTVLAQEVNHLKRRKQGLELSLSP